MFGEASFAISTLKDLIPNSNILQCLSLATIAMAVFWQAARLVSKKTQKETAGLQEASPVAAGYVSGLKTKLREHTPEALALGFCLALAFALRVHGPMQTAADDRIMQKVMQKWPILLTADTLLALQAMLRLLVLASCVLREGGTALISQEVAAISCGAVLARTALVARSSDYMLDGPLGGYLAASCDLFSVPLLAALSRGMRRRSVMATMLALAISALVGSRNFISLADDDVANKLFIFVHAAELLAACFYLFHALVPLAGNSKTGHHNVASRFTLLMMPVQQCLSAYYFLVAFRVVPKIVGAGYPFQILHIGGVAELVAYAGAAVLYMVGQYKSPVEGLNESNLLEV